MLHIGFEKMEHGLSEKFTDKTSPIKNHTDTLVDLGADPNPIHHMNAVTSDVIKVLFYCCTVSSIICMYDNIYVCFIYVCMC